MPALLHTTRLPVRWGDQDALGHVNNARYFTYFEQARIEALDRILPGGWGAEAGPILASISCDFKRPVVHPATVVVRVWGGEPGRTSFPQTYELAVEGDEEAVYARAEAVLVWVSQKTGRPVPLPDALRDALTADAPTL
jgi:acyl-CoA thioester hydrolase